jgi:hypothetical protein
MIRLAVVFLLFPLCFLLVGCPSHSRPLNKPQEIFSEGAYTHEKSGMTFPLGVAEYRRVGIQRYDQEGLDISASYNLEDGRHQIAATVYVYPAPSLALIGSSPETIALARSHLSKQEFEARKR